MHSCTSKRKLYLDRQAGFVVDISAFLLNQVLRNFSATGEGHVSSIVFRNGTIDGEKNLHFSPSGKYVYVPKIIRGARGYVPNVIYSCVSIIHNGENIRSSSESFLAHLALFIHEEIQLL